MTLSLKTLLTLLLTLSLSSCLENINSLFTKTKNLKQTGQNIIYTDNDDGYYAYGKKPSFTKINNTIKDNTTNLIWQNHTSTKENNLTHPKAITFCSNLIQDDHNDWRLPNIEELLSIIDYGKASPSINKIFTNTSSSLYWSSTLYKSDTSLAWGVDFKYGDDFHKSIESNINTRCVRGEALIKSTFKRENNIVKDTTTNLQFQDDNNSKQIQKSFIDAINYCENLTLGGHNNWRLPNIKELLSIADKDNITAINPIFKNTNFLWLYWSSTTDVSSDDFARAVWFRNGGDWIYPKSSSNFTKCVRNKK